MIDQFLENNSMRANLFYRWGQFVFRHKLVILLLWGVSILGCVPFIPNLITPFKSTGFVVSHSESEKASDYLDKHLGYNKNQFVVLYHSKQLRAENPLFIQKIKKSLNDVQHIPLKHVIIYPNSNEKQIGKDKHTAYAAVLFKGDQPMDELLLQQFKSAVKTPRGMSVQVGGDVMFVDGVNQQTLKDLSKADLIAAPVSLITLVLVFGTLIAACVPLVLGGGCALMMLTALYFLGHMFSLSIFTLNIALLLGLCLSLDYSLFIINRFRDELRSNDNIAEVIAITIGTAGKAVFFSGLAVFISLSALLLFPVNILFSVGVGGLVAVFISVAIALTLLPATLSVLKHGINKGPIFFVAREYDVPVKFKTWHFWHRLATMVVGRPLLFFIITLVLLLCLGYPFLHVRFGLSDFHVLPEKSQSRQFFDEYQQNFNQNELTPILLVMKTKHMDPLSHQALSRLYHLTKQLKKNPLIKEVNSIVTTEPLLSLSRYQALYQSPARWHDSGVRQLLKTTTGPHFTVIGVVSRYDANAPETKKLITQLRELHPGKGFTLQLTGIPVDNADVLDCISHLFPYAVAWVMVLTYVVLLVLLRSLFLPFKAILMNVLSLTASYGVLVFIFQEGHLHQFLNFYPQGMLDISLLIIIFCALFGFSMDYEVFLLTRIQEYYALTKDNSKSIVFGIVKSSRIITSAALIVIFICGSFMVADVLMVKEFGLGIAVAIFVDAFIIRTILVPSTMVLVKQWNWYLPAWIGKCLP